MINNIKSQVWWVLYKNAELPHDNCDKLVITFTSDSLEVETEDTEVEPYLDWVPLKLPFAFSRVPMHKLHPI